MNEVSEVASSGNMHFLSESLTKAEMKRKEGFPVIALSKHWQNLLAPMKNQKPQRRELEN